MGYKRSQLEKNKSRGKIELTKTVNILQGEKGILSSNESYAKDDGKGWSMNKLRYKRAILFAFTASAFALILIDCVLFLRPKDESFHIDIAFNAAVLTDEEYNGIGKAQIENPQKKDFRKIQLSLSASNKDEVKELEITIPTISDLNQAINTSSIAQLWTSKHYWQNNEKEDFSSYNYTAIIFCREATKEDLKNMFQHLAIEVSYKNDHEDILVAEYPLNRELKVKE